MVLYPSVCKIYERKIEKVSIFIKELNKKMSRKILPIILIFTMIFSLIGINPVSYAAEVEFAGGLGTETDPYQISTAVQLNNMRNYSGADNHDKYFLLTADIDLNVYPFNDGQGWKPIGNWDTPNDCFYGNFDGGGKTISNLFIDMSDPSITGENPAGLFGEVYDVTIKNLTLTNVNVKGYECVGGLVGDAGHSIITGVNVTGTVIGVNYIGGLTGWTYHESLIANSSFNGSVTGIYDVGGLVGLLDGSAIRKSFSMGSVNGNELVGGLVGEHYSSSIVESFSNSSVTGTNTETKYSVVIGGLVGYNRFDSTISKSYATGVVTGTDVLGGLIGENSATSMVTDSYASGNVSSDADDDTRSVAGLVGSNIYSTIQNCYAVGTVTGTGVWHGGLVGYNYVVGPIISSYSLGPDNVLGTLVTDAGMKTLSTFDGWDFTNIWEINEGISYPTLLPGGVAEIAPFTENLYIYVAYGTSLHDIYLPSIIFVTLDDNTTVPLRVTWDGGDPLYDGNTSGEYTFTGTLTLVDGIANTGENTAGLIVTVFPRPLEIVSVEPQIDITVPNGTAYGEIPFPTSVTVTLDDNTTRSLAVVSWDEVIPAYDGNINGTYSFKGTIAGGGETANTAGVFASVNVIVETPPDSPPVITYQPEDLSVKVGETATFSVRCTANPDPGFQWQFSKNGGKKWNDIPGANSRTYDVTQATIEMNGYLYRVILDNGVESPVTSNAAKLSVTYGTADMQISQLGGEYDSATNEIVWVIRVYNNGPETAQGVVIKNTLANTTKLLSVSVSHGLGYLLKGKTITVNVGEMEADREIEVVIRVLVSRATSTIANTATVTSASLDLDLENNTTTSEVYFQ